MKKYYCHFYTIGTHAAICTKIFKNQMCTVICICIYIFVMLVMPKWKSTSVICIQLAYMRAICMGPSWRLLSGSLTQEEWWQTNKYAEIYKTFEVLIALGPGRPLAGGPRMGRWTLFVFFCLYTLFIFSCFQTLFIFSCL